MIAQVFSQTILSSSWRLECETLAFLDNVKFSAEKGSSTSRFCFVCFSLNSNSQLDDPLNGLSNKVNLKRFRSSSWDWRISLGEFWKIKSPSYVTSTKQNSFSVTFMCFLSLFFWIDFLLKRSRSFFEKVKKGFNQDESSNLSCFDGGHITEMSLFNCKNIR